MNFRKTPDGYGPDFRMVACAMLGFATLAFATIYDNCRETRDEIMEASKVCGEEEDMKKDCHQAAGATTTGGRSFGKIRASK